MFYFTYLVVVNSIHFISWMWRYDNKETYNKCNISSLMYIYSIIYSKICQKREKKAYLRERIFLVIRALCKLSALIQMNYIICFFKKKVCLLHIKKHDRTRYYLQNFLLKTFNFFTIHIAVGLLCYTWFHFSLCSLLF